MNKLFQVLPVMVALLLVSNPGANSWMPGAMEEAAFFLQ